MGALRIRFVMLAAGFGLALAPFAARAQTAAAPPPPPIGAPAATTPLAAPPLKSAPIAASAVAPRVGGPSSARRRTLTADHGKFDILKKPFGSAQEVTAACRSCHTEADTQVMHTLHFTWTYQAKGSDKPLGKAHVLNAFCGNVASNEPRCTSCHAGYGWTDVRKTPQEQGVVVDCLACHDTSGQYAKLDDAAGLPALGTVSPKAKTITGAKAWPVDLNKAALSVGMPRNENCGACHFYGGGGDNVKHGDLSSALVNAKRDVDVHMSKEGAGLVCADCHVSNAHRVAGSRYDTRVEDHPHLKPGELRDTATCQSCHGERPHKANFPGVKLNDHTDRLACQTCHIPSFARGGVATKTWWDWSTAGKLKDGKPYAEDGYHQGDGKPRDTYLSTKGDFKWAENVTPYYAWYDGRLRYANTDLDVNPNGVTDVNAIHGSADDPHSRIWPFKRMEGKQAFDTQNNRFVYNQVWGPTTDTALWTNFNWEKSIKAAMTYVDLPYSGKFAFAETRMYWPITHMVAPKNQAVKCEECHAKNGRMATIAGLYIPGATPSLGGRIGLFILLAALAGVLGHGLLRLFARTRGQGGHHD